MEGEDYFYFIFPSFSGKMLVDLLSFSHIQNNQESTVEKGSMRRMPSGWRSTSFFDLLTHKEYKDLIQGRKVFLKDQNLSILVSFGYHNKIPQIWWLKQKFISHISGGQEVQHQVLARQVLFQVLFSWSAVIHLTVCSRDLFLVFKLGGWRGEQTLVSLKRALTSSEQGTILMTSSNPNYLLN